MKTFTFLAVTGGLFFNSLLMGKPPVVSKQASVKCHSNKCCKKTKCLAAAKQCKAVKLNG